MLPFLWVKYIIFLDVLGSSRGGQESPVVTVSVRPTAHWAPLTDFHVI